LNGVSKSKIMTKASASKNLIGGISLYGGVLAYGVNSALIVVPEVGDNGHPDCYAVPRPREFGVCGTLPAVVPISYAGAGKNKVVSVICDTRWKHGGSENWQGANPRSIARKQLRELASLGLVMRSSFEYEFRGEPLLCLNRISLALFASPQTLPFPRRSSTFFRPKYLNILRLK